MARYQLMAGLPGGIMYEVVGHRKKTKADIEQWIQMKIENVSLDWRIGFTFKLKDDPREYEWISIASGRTIQNRKV